MFEKEIKQYLKRHGFEAFKPKAVLFDMDGVLYNSMPYHAMSWHKSMKKFGLNITPEEAYEFEGMRGVETIKLLAKRQWNKDITDEESAMMYEEKSNEFKRCSKAEKMEGVEELMRKIKADGLKIVVVTGSGQRSLLDKLESEFNGLIHRDLIISSFDVKHGKPNPEPYLCGLKKAGVEPWEGIVVENAPLGVRAGVAANIFTVAVNTGPLPDKMLADEGANIIFDKMTSFRDSWEKLSENWKKQ
ncbi:HAD family hydrolase [Prevotella sp.]|uniref:HAD family hydrolase n=1 Tax=Prevotella sp. TaxID=59823 RepID=UPI003AB76982